MSVNLLNASLLRLLADLGVGGSAWTVQSPAAGLGGSLSSATACTGYVVQGLTARTDSASAAGSLEVHQPWSLYLVSGTVYPGQIITSGAYVFEVVKQTQANPAIYEPQAGESMGITIQNDFAKLLAGLDAMKDKAMDGALAGLKDAADDATGRMRATEAHGDKTGATRANYRAFAVGHGETGSDALGQSIAVVNEKNPGHVATASVDLEAAIGVIYTSVTNYQRKLETEAAGARAVIGPTVQATASDMTRAAAAGSKKALS